MKEKHYSQEQIDYIRSIALGRTRQEITVMFNKRFGENRTIRAIGSQMSRNGIRNKMQGYDTRFKDGHKTWNKDVKGLNLGGEKGWFKKGHTMKCVPIGSETVIDGYVKIKIANPDVWVKKHRYIWEKHYGEIPDMHVILFKDNDRMNVTLENLFMAPHTAMTSVVRRNLDTDDENIRPALYKLAELELTIKGKITELNEEGP